MPGTLGPSSSQSKAPGTRRIEVARPSRSIPDERFPLFITVYSTFRTAEASGLRTYNDIVNSGAYTRSDYQPRPTSMSTEASILD